MTKFVIHTGLMLDFLPLQAFIIETELIVQTQHWLWLSQVLSSWELSSPAEHAVSTFLT